jgi:large conductance mechanosensitive channel
MLREFRDFIARGNVLDLAVAVIIGLDFANYFTVLGPIPARFQGDPTSYADLKKAGVAVLGWGQFITVVINFLILAFVIFLLVRWATRMMRKKEDAPGGPTEVELLTEIRDELRKR